MAEGSYDLEKLSPTAFQQLAADVLIANFGLAVRPLGPGPDGGRDLFCREELPWSGTAFNIGTQWSGYTVFQIKHKSTLDTHPKNLTWLSRQIRREISDWIEPAEGREETPKQLVFVTNVPLTADPRYGTRAKIEAGIKSLMAEKRGEGRSDAERRAGRLKSIEVLSREDLTHQIDVHEGIRRKYEPFLLPGDILNAAMRRFDSPPVDLEKALRLGAEQMLVSDQWVYFGQAGSTGDDKTTLASIAIDLPVHLQNGEVYGSCLDVLIRRASSRLVHDAPFVRPQRHVVLSGPPGNGKTTLSQLLTQAYRVEFLDRHGLVPQPRAVAQDTGDALRRLGLPSISCRRWPLHIDLAAFVRSGGTSQNLMRSIAQLVESSTEDAGLKVTGDALTHWLRAWPWLVIFDGLDEVSEPTARRELISQIESFVTIVDQHGGDVFVVVTTRPTGYDEPLDPNHFEHLSLAQLRLEEAKNYAQSLVSQRLQDEPQRRQQVLSTFTRYLRSPQVQLLARTPLQVAILTVLAEGNDLASERYEMFWNFFETMLKREIAKNTHDSDFIRANKRPVIAAHEGVGFALQGLGERTGNFGSALTPEEFRRVVRADLRRRGFDPDGDQADVLERACRAATRRLVLITPRGGGGIGFDVRSLQELMAARYLTDTTEPELLVNLETIAINPHWRNTWLFAIDRLISDDRLTFTDQFLDRLEKLDDAQHWRLSGTYPLAPHLAGSLVMEGLFHQLPRQRERVANLAVSALRSEWTSDHQVLPKTLLLLASTSEENRQLVRSTMRTLLTQGGVAARAVARLQEELGQMALSEPLPAGLEGLPYIKREPGRSPTAMESVSSWDEAQNFFCTAVSKNVRGTAERAVAAIELMRSGQSPTNDSLADVHAALDNEECAEALDYVLPGLSVNEPALLQQMFGKVVAVRRRRAVAMGLDRMQIIELMANTKAAEVGHA